MDNSEDARTDNAHMDFLEQHHEGVETDLQ